MWKSLRRLFWLALLGGAGYGAYATWQRKHEPRPDGPPEWPPIDESPSAAPPVTKADPAASTVTNDDEGSTTTPDLGAGMAPATASAPGDGPAATGAVTTSGFATVTTDDAAPTADASAGSDAGASSGRRWVEPVDGECPPGYPIKGNDNSGIYHVPGGRFYARTVPERCYANEADAEADGYRRAKA